MKTYRAAIIGLGRMALVVRRPLPYVYLARDVLTSAGIPSQMFDALPLASEPYAAALDLVIGFVRGHFGRGPAIALLRSPHFRFCSNTGADDAPLTPDEVAILDRALSVAGYLGDIEALERVAAAWREAKAGSQPRQALRAAEVVVEIARQLAPLRSAAPCAEQLDRLLAPRTFPTTGRLVPAAAAAGPCGGARRLDESGGRVCGVRFAPG